ncbi:C6 transcription factor [Stagonosporopsis vannaccii]|nr:C6 transcription factor [Stagonosporopsis vannaccii]
MQTTTRYENGREIRRRSRLACDSCASSRVKCNGNHPCRRCEEHNYECSYNRDVRKRGRKRKGQLPLEKDFANTATNSGDSAGLYAEELRHDESTRHSNERHGPAGDSMMQAYSHDVLIEFPSIEATATTSSTWADLPAVLPLSPSAHVVLNDLAWPNRRTSTVCQPATSINLEPHKRNRTSSSASNLHAEYACLAALLPHLDGVIRPRLAHQLLQLYFAPPEGTLFHNASPYVLTPVLRKQSVLNPASARSTTPALLATMIWVSAQTASLPQLLAPGSRATLCSKLQDLVFKLLHDRDLDNWQRVSGRLVQKAWYGPPVGTVKDRQVPSPVIDDVLSLILITIVTSGGDFKRDCLPWWDKATRLIDTMKLHQMDHPDADVAFNSDLEGNHSGGMFPEARSIEAREEMRRTFWLAFALDRHLALSYNGNLSIIDGESHVYIPIPERSWQSKTEDKNQDQSQRQLGPPTTVTGTGFFEFFLPLMTLLGDIINLRRRRHHPRLGTLDDSGSVVLVEKLLERCKESIDQLISQNEPGQRQSFSFTDSVLVHDVGPVLQGATPDSTALLTPLPDGPSDQDRRGSRTRLVTAYAHFILQVLFVLLHGEWDALTMLAWLPAVGMQSEWITSPSFHKCSSHAVLASEAISSILRIDPELIFMPYLFGIYLFHGSLVLLLFADRMPAVNGGSNDAVEAACETIIRAHEACIVTLNTEFQRVFKRVMRATLMVVKDQNKTGWPQDMHRDTDPSSLEESTDTVREQIVDMRKDMLRLYRWSQGGRGLAI